MYRKGLPVQETTASQAAPIEKVKPKRFILVVSAYIILVVLGFSINLIPHTIEVTTLRNLRPGDRVNLEVDMIARYLERMLPAALRR